MINLPIMLSRLWIVVSLHLKSKPKFEGIKPSNSSESLWVSVYDELSFRIATPLTLIDEVRARLTNRPFPKSIHRDSFEEQNVSTITIVNRMI